MSEQKKKAVNKLEPKRQGKRLSQEDVFYILSLKRDDITYDLLKEFFANTSKKPSRFFQSDYFTLPKGKLYNKEDIKTTVGKYIFNLFIISDNVLKLIGYQNNVMNKGGLSKLNDSYANLVLDDKITTEEVHDYINRLQWLGFKISKFMNSSLTQHGLIPNPEIEKKKQELIKKYQKAIENGDSVEIIKMENELLDFAKKENSDVPDMEIYESGARGSFKNNYKNTSLMRGNLKNYGDSEKVTISTSSLVEGIKPDEMHAYADLIVQASGSRAIGTREGGYESKKISTALQDVMLDEAGSDCRTKLTVKILLKDKIKKLFIDRYIVDKNGNLVLLTRDNIDKYVGKYINLRSPMKCNGDKFCSKCAGELYYKIGNSLCIGLLAQKISSKILNLALKKMHDLTISLVDINIDDYINEVKS